MAKRAMDKLVIAYAMVFAFFALFIVPWYRRHRLDADYWWHLGLLVGLIGSLILIIIVEATA